MSLRFRRDLCFALLMVAGSVVWRGSPPRARRGQKLSPGEVTALVNSDGRRIVDLRVDTSSGRVLFDVAFADNDDGRAWAWSSDLTAARMQAMLKAAPRRPAVMVPMKSRLARRGSPWCGRRGPVGHGGRLGRDGGRQQRGARQHPGGGRPDVEQDAAAAAKA